MPASSCAPPRCWFLAIRRSGPSSSPPIRSPASIGPCASWSSRTRTALSGPPIRISPGSPGVIRSPTARRNSRWPRWWSNRSPRACKASSADVLRTRERCTRARASREVKPDRAESNCLLAPAQGLAGLATIARQRQLDHDAKPRGRSVRGVDPAAERLDVAAHDPEAEAEMARLLAGGRRIAVAREPRREIALEEIRHLLRRHARTFVLDDEPAFRLQRLEADPDASVAPGETDGVI